MLCFLSLESHRTSQLGLGPAIIKARSPDPALHGITMSGGVYGSGKESNQEKSLTLRCRFIFVMFTFDGSQVWHFDSYVTWFAVTFNDTLYWAFVVSTYIWPNSVAKHYNGKFVLLTHQRSPRTRKVLHHSRKLTWKQCVTFRVHWGTFWRLILVRCALESTLRNVEIKPGGRRDELAFYVFV